MRLVFYAGPQHFLRLNAGVQNNEPPDEDHAKLAPYSNSFTQLARRDNIFVCNFQFEPVIVVFSMKAVFFLVSFIN